MSHASSSQASSAVRISHIGVAVRTLAATVPLYRDVLGLPLVPLADADGAHIVGLAVGDALIELLEPAGSDTPIGKFVDRRGPGLHHVCFVVPDLDGTLERCRTHGIRLIDEEPRVGAAGKRIAFIHPSATGGVLIELTED
jgi:methylmalonyl-CoA/ethylmalonyl-CoA epimerase